MQERQAQFTGSSNLETNYRNYSIHKGLPQRGVLSLLLFNLYVNNIMTNVPFEVKIIQYADDIAVIAQNDDPDTIKTQLTKALKTI